MKTATLLVLVAMCGIVSARSMYTRQTCTLSSAGAAEIAVKCGTRDSTPAQLCNDECLGLVCTDYKNNNAPSICLSSNVLFCTNGGFTAPSSCDGALTLMTIKGVLVVMLLLATFFVL